MTRMSEPGAVTPPTPARNCPGSWEGLRLARAVHGAGTSVATLVPIALALLLVGCVIPPSLEAEADGGINSPPAITGVATDQNPVSQPGPLTVARGPQAGNLTVTLVDTDFGDQLFVALFVDYNLPDRLPPRSTCSASPNGSAMRIATCSLTSVCAQSDLGVQRVLSVVVSDRATVPDMEPRFQALPPEGRSTNQVFFLACQPPST